MPVGVSNAGMRRCPRESASTSNSPLYQSRGSWLHHPSASAALPPSPALLHPSIFSLSPVAPTSGTPLSPRLPTAPQCKLCCPPSRGTLPCAHWTPATRPIFPTPSALSPCPSGPAPALWAAPFCGSASVPALGSVPCDSCGRLLPGGCRRANRWPEMRPPSMRIVHCADSMYGRQSTRGQFQ